MEAIKKSDLIVTRPAIEDDLKFIYSTWRPSLYYGNQFFTAIDPDIYFDYYYSVIHDILKRPKTQIKIACLKDEPDVILGYSVFDHDTLHYIYLKTLWRGIGIVGDLLPKKIKFYSHITEQGQKLINKYFPKAKFNPFI